MRNKKIILPFIVIAITVLIIILDNLLSTSTTTAVVTVLEKGYSEQKQEVFVIVVPPNMSEEYYKEEAKTKIFVNEPMVWNLIKEDKIYFVNYNNKYNGVSILDHIENIDDNNAIKLK